MNNNNTNNKIIIYEGDDSHPNIDVKIKGETVWLAQAQLIDLFNSSKSNISEHIKHIFEEEELKRDLVVRKFRTTAKDGKTYNVDNYNLDLIISLGYRIKSKIATKFRQWATARLREYIVKGFTINDSKLKENGGGDYWKELLDRIRDIRSSEKALYRQVLDLYATSIDYNPNGEESIKFFKVVQNKLHYATNKHTAAETIYNRVDSKKDFMGLNTFEGVIPKRSEITIAKNYLTKDELFRLNRLVSAFFDLAEIKAQEQIKMAMKDWVKEIDKFTRLYGKGILENSGKISTEEAKEKAMKEYKKYQVKTLSPVEKDYLESIKMLEKKLLK